MHPRAVANGGNQPHSLQGVSAGRKKSMFAMLRGGSKQIAPGVRHDIGRFFG